MDQKYVLILILGLASMYGGYHTHQNRIDTLNRALKSANASKDTIESSRAGLEKQINYAQKVVDNLTADLAALEQTRHTFTENEKAISLLQSQIDTAKGQWGDAAARLKLAIEEERNRCTQKVIPSITMADTGRTVLRNAKLNTDKQGRLSFQHADGVTKLTENNLSPEMADRLRPEFAVTLELAPEPNFDAAMAASDNSATEPTKAIAQAPKDEAERAGLKTRIDAEYAKLEQMKAQAALAESNSNAQKAIAEENENASFHARFKGRNSSAYDRVSKDARLRQAEYMRKAIEMEHTMRAQLEAIQMLETAYSSF
jgi:hypothetical protein